MVVLVVIGGGGDYLRAFFWRMILFDADPQYTYREIEEELNYIYIYIYI